MARSSLARAHMAGARTLANSARRHVLYIGNTPPIFVSMARFYITVVAFMWLAWFVSWHVAMVWRDKPTVQAPRNQYRIYFFIIAIGLVLMYGVVPRVQPVLWQVTPALGWAMVALTG